jgi:hypothetical protein
MDVLIVGSLSDGVVRETAILLEERSRRVTVADTETAARLFTIRVERGETTVEPDLPIFLRATSPPAVRAGFDDAFLHGESLATLWAAAALCRSPVINRPTTYALAGNISASAAINERRAGIYSGNIEVFAGSRPCPPEPDSASGFPFRKQWYAQAQGDWRATPWQEASRNGVYRARWASVDPAYDIVVVLGAQTWRCTTVPLDHLGLEQRSRAICGRLKLQFAALIWDIAPDLQSAALARVDPYPSMEQIQYVWLGLGPAIAEALSR